MARDVNEVLLTGVAHSTPSMVLLKNNTKLCVFTLKTVERYSRASGVDSQHDNYITIEALGKTAERCMTDVKPGNRFMVKGYLRVDDIHGIERTRIRAYSVQDE